MTTPGTPILTRAVHTEPNPLTADLAGPTPSKITIVLSNKTRKPVVCQRVSVILPVGIGGSHLTDDPRAVTVKPPTDAWQCQRTVTNRHVRFDITPPDGTTVIPVGDAEQFKIADIAVNSAAGVCYPEVEEITALEGEDPVPRSRAERLPKFPAGKRAPHHRATNLAVFAADAKEGDPPVVRVTRGSSVKVTFTPAPGLARRLHWQDNNVGVPVNDGASWAECGPLERDTTFVLQTVSESGGTTDSRYDAVTVAVDVPLYPKVIVPPGGDFEVHHSSPLRIPNALTVAGRADITGTATVGGLASASLTTKSLLFGGTATVQGATTITGDLTADDVSTAGHLAATGKIKIFQRKSWPTCCGSLPMTTDGFVASTVNGVANLTLSVTGHWTYRSQAAPPYNTASLLAPFAAGKTVVWRVNCPTCDPKTGDDLARTCQNCAHCTSLAASGKVSVYLFQPAL
ncbi:cupredoxin domain-containing protein [Amycolatopsis panacis]|uniref:Uncharacterized protein n=1 Tax=Amycolatopsis panacis TaxID=2340917 RepID=A0A419I249_9PSEU|nr:hypothetical protein [Amycolatopsis panacis]RJQ83877.1 hypothetical protein D5S19_18910 [Amycolatopsis panacis]